jgi:hypothetical protein
MKKHHIWCDSRQHCGRLYVTSAVGIDAWRRMCTYGDIPGILTSGAVPQIVISHDPPYPEIAHDPPASFWLRAVFRKGALEGAFAGRPTTERLRIASGRYTSITGATTSTRADIVWTSPNALDHEALEGLVDADPGCHAYARGERTSSWCAYSSNSEGACERALRPFALALRDIFARTEAP